jgi:hypothetical protein
MTSETLGPLVAEIRRGSVPVGSLLLIVALTMTGGCVYAAVTVSSAVMAGVIFPIGIGAVGLWGIRHKVRLHTEGIEVQGIPIGTYVWAPLRSGHRKATFNLRSSGKQAEALDSFRSQAAQAIASRGLDRLRAGSPFAWGSCTLDRECLRYRPVGLLRRKEEQTVPYRGLRCAFSAGACSIYAAEGDEPLYKLGCDEPNFFPGFVLFQHLASGR